ncbi:MAG: hypothetical protein AAFU74_16555, partial [Bacteroidota bacterium]
MVGTSVAVTVQWVRQRVVVTIKVRVLNNVKDTIIVVIDVRYVRYPVTIRIGSVVRVKVIGSSVTVSVVVGRVAVTVRVLV